MSKVGDLPLPVARDRAGLRPVSRPVVGRFYWVTFARLVKGGRGHDGEPLQPVIGPMHEDAEVINFPHTHYHIDWRFASARLFDAASWNRDVKLVHGKVVLVRRAGERELNVHAELFRRRVKCRRRMPGYPEPKRVQWQAELEQKMVECGARMKCMRCPHRGVPLLAEMTNKAGVVTCQAHGLRWRVTTGKLVRAARKRRNTDAAQRVPTKKGREA